MPKIRQGTSSAHGMAADPALETKTHVLCGSLKFGRGWSKLFLSPPSPADINEHASVSFGLPPVLPWKAVSALVSGKWTSISPLPVAVNFLELVDPVQLLSSSIVSPSFKGNKLPSFLSRTNDSAIVRLT